MEEILTQSKDTSLELWNSNKMSDAFVLGTKAPNWKALTVLGTKA